MNRWIVGATAGAMAGAAAVVAGYRFAYRPWRQGWIARAEESAKPLPGDALIPDADYTQTLAVTIDAPPSAVWPWLLQMGYGRGGWYSYDGIDMRGHSAREIRPDLQDLTVGAMVPFAPGMAFRVDIVEPARALVLYADDQVAEVPRATAGPSGAAGSEETGAGLRMVGALSEANMRDFRVSWAFVLDPLDGGRTRLLERFRTRATPGPASALVGPIVDHGHFLMTRKQMLGIKERAEGTRAEGTESLAADVPQPGIPVAT